MLDSAWPASAGGADARLRGVRGVVRLAHAAFRVARDVLHFARKYGTSILRNALALASATSIEDGEAGL